MASGVVAPLRTMARELTEVAPNRTLPDWFEGDPAHRAGISDHNWDDKAGWRSEQSDADDIPEIRGWDIRLPLRAPFTPEQLVQWLIKQARAGKLPWLRYVIFKRRIWTRTGGWVTQKYNGSNPHNEHIHVSSLASRDNDTTSANLRGLLPTTQEDTMSKEVVLEALRDNEPWLSREVGLAAQEAGLNPQVSVRALLEYMYKELVLAHKLDAILAAVLNVDEEVVSKLGNSSMSPEQVANVLRPVLGDRAAEVGRALQE
jgi:hypothetical protein